jgi:hypothetical protein
MKKIFSIFLCAAFVFALSANLFAAENWYTNEDLKNKAVIDFRPSSNVSIYYEAGAPAGSDNASDYQEYTAGTKHTGGDTIYGSSSGDSNFYKKQDDDYRGVAQPQDAGFPTAGESDFEGEGWDKL